MRKIDILGTKYTVEIKRRDKDGYLSVHGEAGAYCNFHEKKIVCDSLECSDLSKIETDRLLKQYLRHEILHAFLFESGLGFDSISDAGAWATNEEIVDWFAIQSPFQSTLPAGGATAKIPKDISERSYSIHIVHKNQGG